MQKVLLLEDIYTGIAFLFIQIPYLVLALITFLEEPELLKKLTEWNTATVDWVNNHFSIPKFSGPQDTELPPIDFEQMGLDVQPLVDTNMQDKSVISEAKALIQEATAVIPDRYAEQLKDKVTNVVATIKDKSLEPMEYFDFYNVNDNDKAAPTSNRASNLMDNENTRIYHEPKITLNLQPPVFEEYFNAPATKDNIKPVNNVLVEENHSNKQQIRQGFNIVEANKSNKKSTWWFPMLDFNNLNYFPSLFDKTNMNNDIQASSEANKGDPILNEAQYVKTLINQLYSTLELNNIDISKIDIRKPVRLGLDAVTINSDTQALVKRTSQALVKHSNQELQTLPKINTMVNTNIDTLDSLEGRYATVKARTPLEEFFTIDTRISGPRTPLEFRYTMASNNTSLSSSDRLSTFFYDSTKDQVKIEKHYDDLLKRFENTLHTIADCKIEFNDLLEKFNLSQKADSKSKSLEPMVVSPTTEYFTNSDDFFKAESLDSYQSFSTNLRNLEAIEKVIVNLKGQIIIFEQKIDELDKIISEFYAISQFNGGNFEGNFEQLNSTNFNTMKNKLQDLDKFKYHLLDEFNSKNNNINNLIAKKEALLEFNRDKNESLFSPVIPQVNEAPIEPLYIDTDLFSQSPDTTVNKDGLKANYSVEDLFRINQALVEVDKNIGNFNTESIDLQHKMNELGKEISQFTSEKNQIKQKINNKSYTQWDLAKLNTIKAKLTFLENKQNELLQDFNANKNELIKLEANKTTLSERCVLIKKQLGDLAITPTI